MNSLKTVVEVKDLLKRYNKKEVLSCISFKIYEGEIFVLLGPNGAGKTTTVKILSGILPADGGEIKIFSEKMSIDNLNIKKKIGYLPDDPYLYTKLRGSEFLDLVSSVYKLEFSSENYNFFLEQFELKDVIVDLIDTYSKGMRQKLLLMSIFLREPQLYIFDEPLIGLDPKSISFFKKYVVELANRNKTIIICTHLLDLAEILATRISFIYNGNIILTGTKSEIIEKLNLSSDSSLENIYLEAVKKN